jgi:hypothetical protein
MSLSILNLLEEGNRRAREALRKQPPSQAFSKPASAPLAEAPQHISLDYLFQKATERSSQLEAKAVFNDSDDGSLSDFDNTDCNEIHDMDCNGSPDDDTTTRASNLSEDETADELIALKQSTIDFCGPCGTPPMLSRGSSRMISKSKMARLQSNSCGCRSNMAAKENKKAFDASSLKSYAYGKIQILTLNFIIHFLKALSMYLYTVKVEHKWIIII